jgi:hypothetical protein
MGGALSADRWRIAAASVTGPGHLRDGRPCQDAHEWELLPDGSLAAAVADGAGSAARSDAGAAAAVRAAIAVLRERLPGSLEEALVEAIRAAGAAVESSARQLGAAPSDLATTLIVCVTGADGVLVAQVGDGEVIVQAADGETLRVTGRGRAREYLNETTFLTSPGALDAIALDGWTGAVSHLAILSDGLQLLALAGSEGTPHRPFFDPLFRFVTGEADAQHASERLRSFLASDRVSARTDDDVTLLLASRL